MRISIGLLLAMLTFVAHAESPEPAALKAALRHLVGSVSVVTSGEGAERTGATVTSAYGLSVDPAAMIVALTAIGTRRSFVRS